MKIKIVTVGKTKSDYLSRGINDYLSRLSHYCQVKPIHVQDVKPGKQNTDIIKAREARQIQEKLTHSDFVIALDRSGRSFSSEAFARWLSDHIHSGRNNLAFIIGGPLGLDPSLIANAHATLSLSAMTFTHDMTRLILLEQIYRAFTILNSEQYHK